ncbi:MAG: HAD-IIB family hydrolase [Candidatus Paceibacterota bacterium]|jgi:hypothetical protein
MTHDYKAKKAVIFDLDGTLAESKQSLDEEMSLLICSLLKDRKVAVISGGGMPQLEKQVIGNIHCDPERMRNLFMFPTKGAAMYEFDGKEWKKIYEEALTDEEKGRIIEAEKKVVQEVDFLPSKHFGELLEDRNTEFTFSAFGQEAPIEVKKHWDDDLSKRRILKDRFKRYLQGFEVEIGGSTSIDITKAGMDKGFAIEQFCKYKNIKISEVLFVGDALFVGGNDYPAKRTGVDTVPVKDYNETKEVIKKMI